MKIKVNTEFWHGLNILSRACFIIGATFIDLAFRLSGMEPNKSD